MPQPSERLQFLSQQFDALVEGLNNSSDMEERKQLLQRMMIVIDEIDGLIFSDLKSDTHADASSPRRGQSVA
jgi:hypothetical protein